MLLQVSEYFRLNYVRMSHQACVLKTECLNQILRIMRHCKNNVNPDPASSPFSPQCCLFWCQWQPIRGQYAEYWPIRGRVSTHVLMPVTGDWAHQSPAPAPTPRAWESGASSEDGAGVRVTSQCHLASDGGGWPHAWHPCLWHDICLSNKKGGLRRSSS